MSTNAMNASTTNRQPMGLAFIAGIASGLAAGLLLRSEKGQEITEQASKDAVRLQKQLTQKIKTFQSLTRERYEEIVDELIERYADAKKMARTELKELKSYLMDQWDELKNQWSEESEHAAKEMR
jgi:gas vesicle protein